MNLSVKKRYLSHSLFRARNLYDNFLEDIPTGENGKKAERKQKKRLDNIFCRKIQTNY